MNVFTRIYECPMLKNHCYIRLERIIQMVAEGHRSEAEYYSPH